MTPLPPPAPTDVFDDIALRLFSDRGMPAQPEWSGAIAAAYRKAMADLNIVIQPKGQPKPEPTRTANASLMFLLASLETGDTWIEETNIAVGSKLPASGVARFKTVNGHYTIDVAYLASDSGSVEPIRIERVELPSGQQVTSAHPEREWLKHYMPPPELDVFSPEFAKVIARTFPRHRVLRKDKDRRTWTWTADGEPKLYMDARGRLL